MMYEEAEQDDYEDRDRRAHFLKIYQYKHLVCRITLAHQYLERPLTRRCGQMIISFLQYTRKRRIQLYRIQSIVYHMMTFVNKVIEIQTTIRHSLKQYRNRIAAKSVYMRKLAHSYFKTEQLDVMLLKLAKPQKNMTINMKKYIDRSLIKTTYTPLEFNLAQISLLERLINYLQFTISGNHIFSVFKAKQSDKEGTSHNPDVSNFIKSIEVKIELL